MTGTNRTPNINGPSIWRCPCRPTCIIAKTYKLTNVGDIVVDIDWYAYEGCYLFSGSCTLDILVFKSMGYKRGSKLPVRSDRVGYAWEVDEEEIEEVPRRSRSL